MKGILSVFIWIGRAIVHIWKVFLNFFLGFCISMAGFAAFEIFTETKVMELPNFMFMVLIVAIILCIIITVGTHIVKHRNIKKGYIE